MNKYSSLHLLHSIDPPLDELSNTISDFRPQSPRLGISLLTMNENQNNSKSAILVNSKSSLKFPELTRSPLPSERDFCNLIDKLDQITSSRNYFPKECVLDEDEELNIPIEQDSYYYIKIQAKGKKNPLKVFIRRAQGKVLCYSSLTVQKPSYANCDKIHNTDTFEIRTIDPHFKCDFIFLAIRAILTAKLAINITFGVKNLIQHPFPRRNKKPFIELSEERIKELIEIRKRRYKRNHIEENLHRRMLSPDELQQKNQRWLEKREKAVAKKKQNLEEKKTKALCFLNKQKIREKNEKEDLERAASEQSQKELAKTMLIFLFFLKSFKGVQKTVSVNKREKLRRIARLQFIRKIQRFIRKILLVNRVEYISLIRAQKHLLLFHNSVSGLLKNKAKNRLFEAISVKLSTLKPILKYSAYFEKTLKIQQFFRRYLEVKAERMRKLIKIWDEYKLFQKKRSIKKKTIVQELNVSISQRAQVLESYYLSCVKKFYENLKENIFISEVTDRTIKKFVRFEYIPSTTVIKQIIDSIS